MKTVFRNFFSIVGRFRLTVLLNLIGLCVAFVSFAVIMMQVDYDFSFDSSQPDADRIYRFEFYVGGGQGAERIPLSNQPMAAAMRDLSPHIISLSLIEPCEYEFETTLGEQIIKERGYRVDTNFVNVFRFEMINGSAHSIAERGKCLIPQSLAMRYWNTTDVVGNVLHKYNNQTVGGVYADFPDNSTFGNCIYSLVDYHGTENEWTGMNQACYMLLDDPANAPEVERLLSDKMNEFREKMGPIQVGQQSTGRLVQLTPFSRIHFVNDTLYDFTPKANRSVVLMLLAIAVIIIVIACINFTNFNASLVPMRVKSINTQKVLGAGIARLRAALVLETVMVAAVAWALSLLVIGALRGTVVDELLSSDISVAGYPWLMAALLLVALVVGSVSGLYPAFRVTSFTPALVLKGSFGLSPRGRRLRSLLVAVQFVASFVLMSMSAFIYIQNTYMQTYEIGYDTDCIITTDLSYLTRKNAVTAMERVKAVPGVECVAMAEQLLGTQDSYSQWTTDYAGEHVIHNCIRVSPDFMRVMGIDVYEGIVRNDADSLFVFNRTAVLQYPRLRLGDRFWGGAGTVGGFCSDFHLTSFRQPIAPMTFFVNNPSTIGDNYPWVFNFMLFRVAPGTDKADVTRAIQAIFNDIDPGYPFVFKVQSQLLADTYSDEINMGTLVLLFSILAIVISIIGVSGLMMLDCEYRRKEIGVRRVLGSTFSGIVLMFARTYMRLLAVCFAVSVPLTLVIVNRWLQLFAYRAPLAWWVFVAVFALVAAITYVTIMMRTVSAARENPVLCLKSE